MKKNEELAEASVSLFSVFLSFRSFINLHQFEELIPSIILYSNKYLGKKVACFNLTGEIDDVAMPLLCLPLLNEASHLF